MSTNSGLMRIIEYNSTSDVTVLFVDDGTTKKTTYTHFKQGRVESDYIKIQREKEIKYREELIEKQRQARFESRNKLGESVILENGMIATITRFVTQNDMDVTIGEDVINTDYTTFKNGMAGWVKKNSRQSMIGNVIENKYGTKATIVGFNEKDLTFNLKLDNGYKFDKKCFDIEKNEFYTPYDKTFGGVGCLGEKYVPQDYKKIHIMWSGLLDRVIIQSAKDKKRYAAYKDCSICDRWLNFSNFCDDMLNMWYDCDEQLDIDKDIKCKGNKEYAPDKCLLVPHSINMLFTKWRGGEGVNHQVGVEYIKSGDKKGTWKVKPCGVYSFNGQFRTGVHKYFKSEEVAGEYYRSIKHEYIKKVLKSYEGRIPDYVMNYCLKFEFEMDDYLRNVDEEDEGERMSSLLFLYRVCLERCTYPKTNICSPKLCKLAPTKQMFYQTDVLCSTKNICLIFLLVGYYLKKYKGRGERLFYLPIINNINKTNKITFAIIKSTL